MTLFPRRRTSSIALFSVAAVTAIVTTVGCGSSGRGRDGSSASTDSEELVGAADIMFYAVHAGVPCDSRAVVATAIALAESRGSETALGYNGPTPGCPHGSRDRGLWQINDCYHPSVSDACAFDPQCNADVMASMSGYGSNFWPWATYSGGAYRAYLGAAQAQFDAVCGGGSGGGGGGGGGGEITDRPRDGAFEALDIGFAISAGSYLSQCIGDGERVWQASSSGPDAGSRWAEAQYSEAPTDGCGDAPNGVYPIVFRSGSASTGAYVTTCTGSDHTEHVFQVDGSSVDGLPAASFLYDQNDDDCP